MLDKIEREKIKGAINVTRFKGLGEMNPPQLRESTIHPDTRRLVQLTVDDREQTSSLMDMLLAKRASDRKGWLESKGDRLRWKSDSRSAPVEPSPRSAASAPCRAAEHRLGSTEIPPHRQTRRRHNARPSVWTNVLASHSLLFPGLPLHSARLVLSPIRRDDAAALFAIQSDPDVMRFWNHPAWTRPSEARAQIDDDRRHRPPAPSSSWPCAKRWTARCWASAWCLRWTAMRHAPRSATCWHRIAGPGLHARGPAAGTGLPVRHPPPASRGSRDRPAQRTLRARARTPGLPPRGSAAPALADPGNWPTRPSMACWPMTKRPPPCPLDPIWPVAGSTHGHVFGHIRHGPPPA